MRGKLTIFALVTLAASVIEILNFSGFCYAKGRYLTDKELVDPAVYTAMREQSAGTLRSKTYESIEEFYKQNETCCSLDRGHTPFSDPTWTRVFGFYTAVATVLFRSSDIPSVDNFYGLVVGVNACGSVQLVFGMPSPNGPKAIALPERRRSPS